MPPELGAKGSVLDRGALARVATGERRRQILEAALHCFSEHGYDATTLGHIRERSGASTGSIYHLFASKEEIAGALYVEGLRSYQQGFLDILREKDSPEAMVRACVEFYLGWVEANEPLARFIVHSRQAELVPAVRDELRSMNRAFFGAVAEIVHRHAEAGHIKEMPRELFHAVVMGPAHEYARHWLAGRRRVPLGEAARVLAQASWDAVRAPEKRAARTRKDQETP
jgi:AcrR family transcriptional regulator